MKKILLIILLTISCIAWSQEDAWVYFTDKPDADFYLDNPLEMLSQKALDRRANQGIALDSKDVPLHEPYVTAIANAEGITLMAKSKWMNVVHVRGSLEAINALTGFDFVDYIDFANKALNTPGRSLQPLEPVTSDEITSTEADFDYGLSASQVTMLNGHLLHQQDYTGAGMTIAVLDSGFPGVDTAAPFQRLYDNNLILGGYDFVADSEDFYTADWHGTLVLSTMGGYAEGQLIGTAPDAFYYLFRTEDATSENPVEESYWVEAAEVADSLGVDVINTSLGYFEYDNPDYSYTYEDINGQTAFISRGADIAFSRGMICVTSAGNSGNTNNPHIGVPADAVNTLAVGAVNAEEIHSAFSSTGPTYDMRVKPDVMAQGVAAVVSDTTGEIIAVNGTSFSGPITAGLVACLWQALPNSTNAEIIQYVKQSADRYNNPDIQYGYGIPDFLIALDNGLSIPEKTKDSFILYPNPAENYITVTNIPQEGDLLLYNNLGQVVIKAVVSHQNPVISLQNITRGIYTYKIISGTKTQTGKIIKN